jgi:hypothetical protein
MTTTTCTCHQIDHKRSDCQSPAGCTGCVCERHTTILVARNLGGYDHCRNPDIAALLEGIGSALIAHTVDMETSGTRWYETHRIQFDTRLLRGSTAHSMGYRYGFVVSLEHPEPHS